MTQYLIKIIVTAALIVAVTEVSKRDTLLGGLLSSLPVVSFLAMLWLYFETKDGEKVAELSVNTFWLVIPSLVFFLMLPLLMKLKLSFPLSFGLAAATMFVAYWGMVGVLKGVNTKLG